MKRTDSTGSSGSRNDMYKRSDSTGSHDANWQPPQRGHPALKRMESISVQSYKVLNYITN